MARRREVRENAVGVGRKVSRQWQEGDLTRNKGETRAKSQEWVTQMSGTMQNTKEENTGKGWFATLDRAKNNGVVKGLRHQLDYITVPGP